MSDTGRKQTVRIALAIDSTGEYSACGWGRGDGHAEPDWCLCEDTLSPRSRRYIIEAEVELPPAEPEVVPGRVVE